MSMAERSKARVCSYSLAGVAGLNPARGFYACLLWVSCVVRQRSLWRASPSSKRVLPSVTCLIAIKKPQQWGSLGPQRQKSHKTYGSILRIFFSLLFLSLPFPHFSLLKLEYFRRFSSQATGWTPGVVFRFPVKKEFLSFPKRGNRFLGQLSLLFSE
jgi:hypothetical protein